MPHALLTPENLVAAFIAMNVLAFAAFGIDKWKARTGRWRTPESTLLMLAALGGTPGAYLGRHLFRHKTRKQPFVSLLGRIAVMQVVGLGGYIGWQAAAAFTPS